MKTITIDFELYQKELRLERLRGTSHGVMLCQNLIGATYDNYKAAIDDCYQSDDTDLRVFLERLYPDYRSRYEKDINDDQTLKTNFTEDDIPF